MEKITGLEVNHSRVSFVCYSNTSLTVVVLYELQTAAFSSVKWGHQQYCPVASNPFAQMRICRRIMFEFWLYGSNVIFLLEESKTQEVKLTEETFFFYKDNFSSSNLHSLHLHLNCEVKEKIIYFHVSIISISNCLSHIKIIKVPL